MMKPGERTTLYFFDKNGEERWAEVEYIGRNRQNEYKFRSVLYGWLYFVSEDLETVLDSNWIRYRANTKRAWFFNMQQ